MENCALSFTLSKRGKNISKLTDVRLQQVLRSFCCHVQSHGRYSVKVSSLGHSCMPFCLLDCPSLSIFGRLSPFFRTSHQSPTRYHVLIGNFAEKRRKKNHKTRPGVLDHGWRLRDCFLGHCTWRISRIMKDLQRAQEAQVLFFSFSITPLSPPSFGTWPLHQTSFSLSSIYTHKKRYLYHLYLLQTV